MILKKWRTRAIDAIINLMVGGCRLVDVVYFYYHYIFLSLSSRLAGLEGRMIPARQREAMVWRSNGRLSVAYSYWQLKSHVINKEQTPDGKYLHL